MILIDPSITVASVSVSTLCKAIEITGSAVVQDNTTFGSGWETKEAGLKGGSVRLSFKQGYGTSTAWAALGLAKLGTTVTVVVKPAAGSTSASNPQWTFDAVVETLQFVSGAVGDVITNDVTWPITGAIVEAVA